MYVSESILLGGDLMFWRFASDESASTTGRVLLVNQAVVVLSRCDRCGGDLLRNSAGEQIVTAAGNAPREPRRCYCMACACESWFPTLSGRNLMQYSLDWGIALQCPPGDPGHF